MPKTSMPKTRSNQHSSTQRSSSEASEQSAIHLNQLHTYDHTSAWKTVTYFINFRLSLREIECGYIPANRRLKSICVTCMTCPKDIVDDIKIENFLSELRVSAQSPSWGADSTRRSEVMVRRVLQRGCAGRESLFWYT